MNIAAAHLVLATTVYVRALEQQGTPAMKHRFTLDALRELIVARRDGEHGLRICVDHVQSSRLRPMLLAHLAECTQALQELRSLVRLLGGESEPLDFVAAHRKWADLRAALACNDDGVILDECERGESRALEVYRNALDDPLPEPVRTIVLRQFEDVMINHDQIRDLRSQPRLGVDLGAGGDNGAQAGPH